MRRVAALIGVLAGLAAAPAAAQADVLYAAGVDKVLYELSLQNGQVVKTVGPIGKELTGNPRCRLVHGDFFAMSSSAEGFDKGTPGRQFDAVLVDIDHSPRKLLHPRHAALYEPEGLARLAGHLRPGGVFALWSNDPPDDAFEGVLAGVFAISNTHVVTFDDWRGDHEASNTVYVGVKADRPID